MSSSKRNKKDNSVITNIILFVLLFLMSITILSINLLVPDKPEIKPIMPEIAVYVDDVLLTSEDVITLGEVGDKKTIEVKDALTNKQYDEMLEINYDFQEYISITDISNTKFNTKLELVVLKKSSEEFYLNILNPAINLSFRAKLKIHINTVESIEVPNVGFYS